DFSRRPDAAPGVFWRGFVRGAGGHGGSFIERIRGGSAPVASLPSHSWLQSANAFSRESANRGVVFGELLILSPALFRIGRGPGSGQLEAIQHKDGVFTGRVAHPVGLVELGFKQRLATRAFEGQKLRQDILGCLLLR